MCVSSIALSQKTEWIDSEFRNQNYPSDRFLLSFNSQKVNKDEDYNKILSSLTEYSKAEVVQSLQTKVNSTITSNTEINNTETNELFEQKNVSVSSAQLVGLQTEKFYDKRKKIAYVFVYVSKFQLSNYYKQTIEDEKKNIVNKIKNAQKLLENENKKDALKLYYEALPFFENISEPQSILIALGVYDEFSLKTDELNNLKNEITTAIAKLLNDKNLSIDEASFFIACNLFHKTGKIIEPIALSIVSYENTTMQSQFSEIFNTSLNKDLIAVANYKISTNKNTKYKAQGTYWVEDNFFKVIFILSDKEQNKAIESSIVYISLDKIKKQNINYIPESYKKIELIERLKIESENSNLNLKITEIGAIPLKTNVYINDTIPIDKIPIKFYFADNNEKINTIYSNFNGRANCFIKNTETSNKIRVVFATLDIVTFLQIEEGSEFYEKIEQEYKIPKTRFLVQILGPAVYFNISEKNLNSGLNIPIIEPEIKETLSILGYSFTSDINKSDYNININANTRRGSSSYGIYFAYLDVNISITDMNSGKEIYKKNFTDIKAGADSYNRAGIKAYENITETIKQEIDTKFKELN